MSNSQQETREEEEERHAALRDVDAWLETPMLVLGLVWLALFVLELVHGLNRVLAGVGMAIWTLFILEFALRFALAPRKLPFLRRNVLTVVALLIPALRVVRVARIVMLARSATAVRGIRLVRLITSLSRGMRSVRRASRSNGVGYVLALTLLVTLTGAAGMYTFESNTPGRGLPFESYGDAVWWTAMIMTTMGSEWWPRTLEGRLLCILLSVYAFAMFGYVTATFASFFVQRDQEARQQSATANARASKDAKDVPDHAQARAHGHLPRMRRHEPRIRQHIAKKSRVSPRP